MIEDFLIREMLKESNEIMIKEVKEEVITLDDDKELLVNWLRANLSQSPQILTILECFAQLLYDDNMEREYIIQFINRVREVSNQVESKW